VNISGISVHLKGSENGEGKWSSKLTNSFVAGCPLMGDGHVDAERTLTKVIVFDLLSRCPSEA
jgi:hypothetical protein